MIGEEQTPRFWCKMDRLPAAQCTDLLWTVVFWGVDVWNRNKCCNEPYFLHLPFDTPVPQEDGTKAEKMDKATNLTNGNPASSNPPQFLSLLYCLDDEAADFRFLPRVCRLDEIQQGWCFQRQAVTKLTSLQSRGAHLTFQFVCNDCGIRGLQKGGKVASFSVVSWG